MESSFFIPTTDGHRIYLTMDKVSNSETLVIMVHGLSGSSQEHMFVNWAKFFNQHEYDVCRVDLYAEKEWARTMSETNISEHSDDLILVIKHFEHTYKKIFLIGHSLWWLVIMRKKLPDVQGAVLWDPSLYPSSKGVDSFIPDKNMYLLDRWEDLYISPRMMQERTQDKTEMIAHYYIPTKVISAGRGTLKDQREPIKKDLQFPCEFVVIEWASHCFDEEGTEENLFKETLNRIGKK